MPNKPWTGSTIHNSISFTCGDIQGLVLIDNMIPNTDSPASWNELIGTLPLVHLLQTWEWSQVKRKYGWQAMPFVWPRQANKSSGPLSGTVVAAAMILKRVIPVGGFGKKICVLYIPKGPLMDWNDTELRLRVLDDLRTFANRQSAIFIKIDPDVALGTGVPGTEQAHEDGNGQAICSDLTQRGWKFSQDQIQFRNTILVDLTCSEEDLLKRMKQKTRYNIRLAQKKGVIVRTGTEKDLALLYHMYAETSQRDGFIVREEGYYQTVWHSFMSVVPSPSEHQPFTDSLIAEVEEEPVGAVSMFYFANQAIYLLGMSRDAHREKMSNYLLQWEAIRRAKALNCKVYNLWGAPNEFDEKDGLWGVFRFKEGLGGTVFRTIGGWDFSPNKLLYNIYTQVLPHVMDIMRVRARSRVRQSLL
jgi:peptidoglycan pentaglycine glycine transferase (the first glycine)